MMVSSNLTLEQETKRPALQLVYSILLAVLFDVEVINLYLVSSGLTDTKGVMALLYIAVYVSLISVALFAGGLKHRRLVLKPVVYVILFSLGYLFTSLLVGSPGIQLAYFGVYVLCSILIPLYIKIDTRTFLKAVMVLSSPALVYSDTIFVIDYAVTESISMGTSYAFLAPVISTIVYLFRYLRQESVRQKVFTIFFAGINMIFAAQMLMFGSRGPVLALASILTFLYISRYDSSRARLMLNTMRTFLAIAVFLFVGFMFIPVLTFFQHLADSQGIHLSFVDKILFMSEIGDLSNGRDDIMPVTIAGIMDSPIWGNGFDRFFANTGIVYPHNFLLQLLYDGGVLLFLLFICPILRRTKELFSHCSFDESVMIITLLFCSVPKALFSGNLWENSFLWLLFGVSLVRSISYK